MLNYLQICVKYHLKHYLSFGPPNSKQSRALSKGLLFSVSSQRILKSQKKSVGLKLGHDYKKRMYLLQNTFHLLDLLNSRNRYNFSIMKVILVGPKRSYMAVTVLAVGELFDNTKGILK